MAIVEHRRRRERLMRMMEPGSIAVLPAAEETMRNRDTAHLFRQDSDFYYLTGFEEPGALLVLAPGREHGEVILFCQERDPAFERWNGERVGPERAQQVLAVDDAFPMGDVEDILPGLLEGRERIYVTLGEHPSFDTDLLGWVKSIRAREASGARPPGEFVALRHLLHDLRLFKSAAELKLMRKAAGITVGAHLRAMHNAKPGLTEAHLEAEIIHEFMSNGARFPAYPCIVGAGENACIMHYVRNDATLKDGDLVLIDAGCEYQYYASDVTRTFPINGRFTGEQRAIYEIVLAAQTAAIASAQPGAHFNVPHETAIGVMVDGLLSEGLLTGSKAEILETESYQKFCVHKTSHWLGIDVHDVGDYRVDDTWRALEPGMVITVEPGIYIAGDEATAPPRLRGVGIRIEDDVLITKAGNEVLTEDAPKEIDAIEAAMHG